MTEFKERTITVNIDDRVCGGCTSKACVTACRIYGRGILTLKEGKPTVLLTASEAARVGIECLACEYDCRLRGLHALTIDVPMPELDEFRRTLNTGGEENGNTHR
jgi:hypothetical protein